MLVISDREDIDSKGKYTMRIITIDVVIWVAGIARLSASAFGGSRAPPTALVPWPYLPEWPGSIDPNSRFGLLNKSQVVRKGRAERGRFSSRELR